MKYIKDTSRLTVQFINSKTDEVIFEIKNRNWTNIGELFTDHLATEIINQNIKGEKPKNLLILAFGEYTLNE